MKTAILTDSAAIIAPQIKHKLAIKTLSLPLLLNGKRYYEKYDYDRQQVKAMLHEKNSFLMCGQVSVTAIDEFLNELIDKGYTDVIWVHLDNDISGLGNNLRSYQQRHDQINIHLVDSYSMGVAEGNLAVLAAKLVAQGKDWNAIEPILKEVRNSYRTVMILKNLRHISTTGYVRNGVFPIQKTIFRPQTLMSFNAQGQLEVQNAYMQHSKLSRKIRRMIMPAYQEMAGQLQITITAIRTRHNDQVISRLIKAINRTFPAAQIKLYEMNLSMIAHIGTDGIVISWG